MPVFRFEAQERRDGEVSSSAAAAALGKLLFGTGYFPAKPSSYV
jgi:hypothetical protein